MTPAEAIARGRSIGADVIGDPFAASIAIIDRVHGAVAAGEIPGHAVSDVLRGAAFHACLIVHCVDAAAKDLDALEPRAKLRAFLSRVAGYLGHRSAGDVIVALCCASMGAAEFTNGRTGWAALLFAVAGLNLFCAWLSSRRAKGSA
jgi:hypothetical protein